VFEDLPFTPIEDQLDAPLQAYYFQRVKRHTRDSYLGVWMAKFPEDLRTYEHLMWETETSVVVEIGSGMGGSALWFRDRLLTNSRYRRIDRFRVISMDVDVAGAVDSVARLDPDHAATITFVEGDVRDPSLVAEVERHLPAGGRVLLVEDSAHRYDTTMAALEHYSHLVPVGGYAVVEDGLHDVPGLRPPHWPAEPSGVLPALDDWLLTEAGQRFEVDRRQERYITTSHPRGFVRRTSAA
jgi:cephalosporin hydroxylase